MSNPVQQVADVVTLPVRTVGNQASSIASASGTALVLPMLTPTIVVCGRSNRATASADPR